MRILILLPLALLTACSSIGQRQRSRDLQTNVIRAINANGPKYAQCAKEHHLFKKLNASVVRLEVDVKINHQGQIEEFKTDNTSSYPNEFLNCVYNVLEKSDFPKLGKNEVVQFKQPFIFRRP